MKQHKMDRFLKSTSERRREDRDTVSPIVDGSTETVNTPILVQSQTSSKKVDMELDHQPQASSNFEVDLENLPSDPGLRPNIMSYPPNSIEQVRRAYLLKSPCQPYNHDFPQRMEANRKRKFVASWFNDYKTWLEYSIAKDAIFCLYCYLFFIEKGHDAFVSEGFSTWRKKEKLRLHVGDHNSDHNRCRLASVKEQMGIVLRYVNKKGCVIERFLGVVHVSGTTAVSLEKTIDSFFSTYGLSISSLRGQGYDGASNMRGEFNGLKSLILKRNLSAYYVHCFAHQLQLTIVDVAKKHSLIGSFFNNVSRLCNVVGGSCKRRDMFRESQREKILEGIANDEIKTGRGLNQEMALKRPGDTRWSSHYGTLLNLMHLFASVVELFEFVEKNGNDDAHRGDAIDLLDVMSRFEFVFVLHLMKQILGITHELSQVLQKKDQYIVNAFLVKVAKIRLQSMRDNGWETLVAEVCKFCSTNEIEVLDMEDEYVARGRGRRRIEKMTNLHQIFYSVIDMQALELNQRFDGVNTKLLLCMSCFNPKDSFSAFDAKKIFRLTKFYPSEFSEIALYELESQLENFIVYVRIDEKFTGLSGIGDLAQMMVSTRKHDVFPLVYLLIKLSLTLPVATATVERAFSAMSIIKSTLRNHMGDRLLNDCLVSYIEKDVFVNVTNDAIMERFQNMKNRR